MGFEHKGFSCNKFRSHLASFLADAKAINFAAIIESVMQVYFLDPQEIAPHPSMNTHPLIGE